MIVNRSAPSTAVVPVLVYPDVSAAIPWLCDAFGFAERLRAPGRDGTISHAQLMSGAGDIMIGAAGGPFTSPEGDRVNHLVVITVDDVDAHFKRAQSRGVRIIQPPEDMPFGARHYTAADLAGHWWTFSQNIADVDPSAWGATVKSSSRPSASR